MGTNFYWIGGENKINEYNDHIGKRCGAGLWCYECDVTLFIGDISRLHYSNGNWNNACPKCEKIVRTTTCSFTWATEPFNVYKKCCLKPREILVVDEYGTEFKGYEFLLELKFCKIHYEHIGQQFA